MERYEFTLPVDHFQVYVEDAASTADISMIWTDQTLADMLAVVPNLIAIGTARAAGTVTVVVELHDHEPTVVLDQWDRVARCSIAIPSGQLLLSAPETTRLSDNPRIVLPPGIYGALVCFGNIDAVTDELALHGEDTYTVMFWPGAHVDPAIITP